MRLSELSHRRKNNLRDVGWRSDIICSSQLRQIRCQLVETERWFVSHVGRHADVLNDGGQCSERSGVGIREGVVARLGRRRSERGSEKGDMRRLVSRDLLEPA